MNILLVNGECLFLLEQILQWEWEEKVRKVGCQCNMPNALNQNKPPLHKAIIETSSSSIQMVQMPLKLRMQSFGSRQVV